MKDIISNIFPGDRPTHIFNGFILYYFLLDFLVRLQLQELPTLSVQPYLALNIRKKSIVHYLNAKTLFSLFNILPIFIFLPFCFTQIVRANGSVSAIAIAVCILSLTTFNNFFGLWLKRKGGRNTWFLLAGVSLALALAGLDYLNILSLRKLSDILFSAVISSPYISAVFIALAAFTFLLNSKFLFRNLYVEELSHRERKNMVTDFPFFDRFGRVGQLAALELKLILRHKRSRGTLFFGLIIAVVYGMVFLTNRVEVNGHPDFSVLFISFFITAIFHLSYGQYMFAWQSGHFDGLMASRVKFSTFIKAKFLLFNLFGTITGMLCLLYGFISWQLIFIFVCMSLYTMGFGSVIVLFFANYNRKRLDLTRNAAFNYQGVGASQWLMGIPLMLIPVVLFITFQQLFSFRWGVLAIGIFGLITLAMQELWIRWLTNLFNRQRYKIAEGFRE